MFLFTTAVALSLVHARKVHKATTLPPEDVRRLEDDETTFPPDDDIRRRQDDDATTFPPDDDRRRAEDDDEEWETWEAHREVGDDFNSEIGDEFSDVTVIPDLNATEIPQRRLDEIDVTAISFVTDETRRLEDGEQLVLTMSNDEKVTIALEHLEEFRRMGDCGLASSEGEAMDAVVTGCGDDRLITVSGLGSWEFDDVERKFRRMTVMGTHGLTDQVLMPGGTDAARIAKAPRSFGNSVLPTREAVETEIRYYYDQSFYKKHGSNHDNCKRKVRDIHAHASVMMRHPSIGIRVYLNRPVEAEFIDENLQAAGGELPKFRAWLTRRSKCKSDVALHHLLTDKRSGDYTMGIAYVSAACNSDCWNTGITEDGWGNSAYIAKIVVHELGHNFGMQHTFHSSHNGRNCKGYMSYGNDFKNANGFSACGQDDWRDYYAKYVTGVGQSRADKCFKPKFAPQGWTAKKVFDKGECQRQGKYLGTKHRTPTECLAAAIMEPSCGDTIMWAPRYNYAWGCRCCAKGFSAIASFSRPKTNTNWVRYSKPAQQIFSKGGCAKQGKNLGTKHKNPESCLLAAKDHSQCGDAIMWAPRYNYAWGCRCCAKGHSSLTNPSNNPSGETNSNWRRYTMKAELLYSKGGCRKQGRNLGTSFKSPEQCLIAAKDHSQCGRGIMWAPRYNYSWGCRCCGTSDDAIGSATTDTNANWQRWTLNVGYERRRRMTLEERLTGSLEMKAVNETQF